MPLFLPALLVLTILLMPLGAAAQPPTVAVEAAGGDAWTSQTIVSVRVTASEGAPGDGIDAWRVRDSAGVWSPWVPAGGVATIDIHTTTTIVSPPGPVTIEAEARDNTLLLIGSGVDAVGYDPIPPVVDSLATVSGSVYTSQTVVALAITASDSLSGVVATRLARNAGAFGAWEAFAPVRPWPLAGIEGTETIRVQVHDAAWNISAEASIDIIHDVTPPTGTVTINGGDAVTSAPLVVLSLAASDALSPVTHMRLGSDPLSLGPWQPFAASLPWTLAPTTGFTSVHAQFRDAAGNESPVVSDTILLDVDDPTGSVIVAGGADYTTGTLVGVTLTAADTGSGLAAYSLSNDGISWSPWSVYTPSTTWTLDAGDGLRTVYARFRDGAGRVSAVASDDVFLDQTAPTGALTIDGGADFATITGVTLAISADDGAGSGVAAMRLRNGTGAFGPWVPFAASTPWTLPAVEGTRTVEVQLKDAAGHVSLATISDAIFLDLTDPTATLVINAGDTYASSTLVQLAIAADDGAGSGVAEMQFSNDGFSWSSFEPIAPGSTWTLAAGSGPRTVRVIVRDAAGRTSAVATDDIWLDTEAPTGGFVINAGDSFTSQSLVALANSVADTGGSLLAEMRFSNDGTNWTPWVPYTPIALHTLDGVEGLRTVQGQFRDGAGNVLTTDDSITFDSTPPTATLVIGSGQPFTSLLAVFLNVTASDGAGIGVRGVAFSNDNVVYTDEELVGGPRFWGLTPGPDGPRTVYIRVTDLLGNSPADYTTSATITYDLTPPTATIAINGGDTWTSQTLVSLTVPATDNLSGVAEMRFSNDSLTWGPWTPYANPAPWTIATGDGLQGVYAQFRDAVQNTTTTGAALYDSILLDQTPPTGDGLINNGAPWTNSTSVVMTLSYTDGAGIGVADVRFRNNGGAWGPWTPVAASLPWTMDAGDGIQSVDTQFRDALGNVSAVYTDTIILDTVAPVGTIVINADDVWTGEHLVALLMTYADPGGVGVSEMRFRNDSGDWSAWVPVNTGYPWLLGPPDGTRTVAVQFRDNAGNISDPFTDSIQLDTTGPVGTVTINGGAGFTLVTNVTLTFAASDGIGIGGIQYRVRNQGDSFTPWAPFTASRPWMVPAGDGPKVVEVEYRDALLNVAPIVSTTITVDTTPPTGGLSLPGGDLYTSQTVVVFNVTATDGLGSGVTEMRFSTDNITWTPWLPFAPTYTWTFTPNGNAVQGLIVQFGDALGNRQNILSQVGIVILDTTQPTATITINGGAAQTNSREVTLTLTAVDEGGGPFTMRFSNDGVNWTPWEPFAVTRSWTLPDVEGPHTVYTEIRDTLGIVSPVASDDIILDTLPPTIDIEAPVPGITNGTVPVDFPVVYKGAATVTLTPADVRLRFTGSATATVSVLNGNTPTPTIRLSGISGNGDLGVLIYAGTAVDAAGNVAPESAPSPFAIIATTIPGSAASARNAQVGGPIVGSYVAVSPGAAPLSRVDLHVRQPGLPWQLAGPVTNDAWTFMPTQTGDAADGIYYFQTVAYDTAGNSEGPAPSGTVGIGDVMVVYNDSPNSPLTLDVPAGFPTLQFPMTADSIVEIRFMRLGVFVPGRLTVRRDVPLPLPTPPGVDPARLVDERLAISKSAGLLFDIAEVRWPFDPANVPAGVSPNTAFRFQSNTFAGNYPATVTSNVATWLTITDFSEWYLGDAAADVPDWIHY